MSDENIGTTVQTIKDEVTALNAAFTKPDGTKEKLQGLAKFLTLGAMGLILIFGILGNFAFMSFNMATYTNFVPVFAVVLAPFVLSIGANSAVKKINENKVKKAAIEKNTGMPQ